MGALGSMILAVLYRALTWQKSKKACSCVRKRLRWCVGCLWGRGLASIFSYLGGRRDRALGAGMALALAIPRRSNDYLYWMAPEWSENPNILFDLPADAR